MRAVALLVLVWVPLAHAAPRRLVAVYVTGRGAVPGAECPSAARVGEQLIGLLPNYRLAPPGPRQSAREKAGVVDLDIEDQGERWDLRIEAEQHEWHDAKRQCDERARTAAVFAALVLEPPSLMLDVPRPGRAPSPPGSRRKSPRPRAARGQGTRNGAVPATGAQGAGDARDTGSGAATGDAEDAEDEDPEGEPEPTYRDEIIPEAPATVDDPSPAPPRPRRRRFRLDLDVEGLAEFSLPAPGHAPDPGGPGSNVVATPMLATGGAAIRLRAGTRWIGAAIGIAGLSPSLLTLPQGIVHLQRVPLDLSLFLAFRRHGVELLGEAGLSSVVALADGQVYGPAASSPGAVSFVEVGARLALGLRFYVLPRTSLFVAAHAIAAPNHGFQVSRDHAEIERIYTPTAWFGLTLGVGYGLR